MLTGTWLGLAPIAWIAATVAYYSWVAHRLLETSPGMVAALLALPPVVGEIAFTRLFEVPRHGWSRGVRAGLLARLLFAAVLAYLFVWIPLTWRETTDGRWFAQDISTAPLFFRIVWLASPVPSWALGGLCAGAYVAWTVRRRRARFVTTIVLPAVATAALFVLMYQFPAAAIRRIGKSRPAFATLVWRADQPEHRFTREVMVTADERLAVATFGSSFPVDTDDPAPNELELGGRCDPNGRDPGECRRNLALIDLDTGTTRRVWSMTVTRRFWSETGQRFFVAPWNLSALLDLQLDGSIRKYALPAEIGGRPLREINHTYYAADVHRVYMTNNNNPVVLAWDVDAARLAGAVEFTGWRHVHGGDSTIHLARSRSRQRLYVMIKSDPHVIAEVDEHTLTPTRGIMPAPDAYDIEISPDETTLWTSSFFTEEIARFDVDTLTRQATLHGALQSRRIALSPDGAQLFAASYVTGELLVFDTRTNEEVERFYVAPRLEGMHVAARNLYLLSADGLYRIPLAALRPHAEHS